MVKNPKNLGIQKMKVKLYINPRAFLTRPQRFSKDVFDEFLFRSKRFFVWGSFGVQDISFLDVDGGEDTNEIKTFWTGM